MALVPFGSVDRIALRWLRGPGPETAFTLSSGDANVATLRWTEGARSLATAETADAQWTLKRGGFLNPHITARRAGSPADLARLSVHLSYHRIELAGGPGYRFRRAGLLVPAWTITTDDGVEVAHIEPVREGRTLVGGAVLVPAAAADRPELLLLVVLGWYFIVLAWFEDEALVPLEGPDASERPTRPAPP
jgi:hypothetical protein